MKSRGDSKSLEKGYKLLSLSRILFNSNASVLVMLFSVSNQLSASASILFSNERPFSVMEISTCRRLFSQISRFSNPFCLSFSTNLVALLFLSIIRQVISASISGLGWLPRRIRKTLYCSGVMACTFSLEAFILYNHPAVNMTLTATFSNSFWNFSCLISFSNDIPIKVHSIIVYTTYLPKSSSIQKFSLHHNFLPGL